METSREGFFSERRQPCASACGWGDLRRTRTPRRGLRRRPHRAKTRQGRAGAREPRRDNGPTTASVAHEVIQPIAATLINAGTALRSLDRQPPNLELAKVAIDRILNDGKRATDIVSRIRDFSKKAPSQKEDLEINEAILEILTLTRVAMSENGVLAKTQLS